MVVYFGLKYTQDDIYKVGEKIQLLVGLEAVEMVTVP